jgi:hypothetical protein
MVDLVQKINDEATQQPWTIFHSSNSPKYFYCSDPVAGANRDFNADLAYHKKPKFGEVDKMNFYLPILLQVKAVPRLQATCVILWQRLLALHLENI